MATEFTIAINPNGENLENELKALKISALYADKINIISPTLDIYSTLNTKSKNKKNIEIEIISKLLKSLPICEFASKEELSDEKSQLLELEFATKSAGYKSSSLVERMKIQNVLKESQKGSIEDLDKIFGEENIQEIFSLGKNLNVENFKNIITNISKYYEEYLDKIEKLSKKTNLLLDIKLENTLVELPIFLDKSIEEIFDIKNAVRDELTNFNKALDKFEKAVEKSKEEIDIVELFKEIVESDYKILVDKLNNIESTNKKITLNYIKKEDLFIELEKNLVKNSMKNSANITDEIEDEKYTLAKDLDKDIFYYGI